MIFWQAFARHDLKCSVIDFRFGYRDIDSSVLKESGDFHTCSMFVESAKMGLGTISLG